MLFKAATIQSCDLRIVDMQKLIRVPSFVIHM